MAAAAAMLVLLGACSSSSGGSGATATSTGSTAGSTAPKGTLPAGFDEQEVGSSGAGSSTTATPGSAPVGGTTVGLCTFPGAVPQPTVTPSGAPQVTTQVSAPLGAASSSPTLASAYQQFNTMQCTHYQHSYTETPNQGIYYYDCVGFTGYTVRVATPQAWASVQSVTGIAPGYVPTPTLFASFFNGLAATPQAGWQAVTTGAAILPGDVLAWGPEPNNTEEAGHSVMALSAPQPLGDGKYALVVMDSTATDHGPDDTRRSAPLNQRNAPLGASTNTGSTSAAPSTAPSGLGIGTIGLVTDPTSGAVTGIQWSIGVSITTVTFGAGRPVS
ncbi:MAG: hypothetical protein U0Q07_05940 [Acidimicrobiales bacterium]